MNMNICYKPFQGAESTASGCPSTGRVAAILPTRPYGFIRERRCAMSDYEIIMVVLTSITVVLALIKSDDR